MDLESHNPTYNLLGKFLGDIGLDLLEITFGISQYFLNSGYAILDFSYMRLGSASVDKYIHVAEQRIVNKIFSVCPSVTYHDDIEVWRKKLRFKMLEMFNWVEIGEYE